MGRIRKPDIDKATSLLLSAEREMAYLEKLPRTEEGAATLIRSTYENFRMLGEAALFSKGFEEEKDTHKQMIDALIFTDTETKRPIVILQELRSIRHKISYDGYWPLKTDLDFVLSIKNDLWIALLNEVKKIIKSKRQ